MLSIYKIKLSQSAPVKFKSINRKYGFPQPSLIPIPSNSSAGLKVPPHPKIIANMGVPTLGKWFPLLINTFIYKKIPTTTSFPLTSG